MKRLMVAVMFLTRVPLPATWQIGTEDIGRSTAFFPLVGAGIGAFQAFLLWFALRLAGHAAKIVSRPVVLPALVLAALITAMGAWITRGLHLDGVADMADGFGGGKTPEDVLRIMRDHQIGSFGGIALVLVLAVKFSSIAALIERGTALPYLVIAPTLARASVVALGFLLPYARSKEGGLGGFLQHVGLLEFVLSGGTALALLLLVGWRRGVICLGMALLVSLVNAYISMRRIGGITGDTLGANLETCEALVLATGSILSS